MTTEVTRFTGEDLNRLAAAYREIQELKKFIIHRAEVYFRVEGKDITLAHTNGFYVDVSDYQLFRDDQDTITITQMDGQAHHDRGRDYQIPRDFIFNGGGELEQKWETYLALQAELEPNKINR